MIKCPHCGIDNEETGSFCHSCGKAVKSKGAGPQVVGEDSIATTTLGQGVQSDQLRKQMNAARSALFVVALLHFVAFALVFVVLYLKSPAIEGGSYAKLLLQTVAIANFVQGVVYVGLGVWAGKNPFPAAIAGLALFVTVLVVNAATDPSTITKGWPVKLLVILALVRAIHAGNRYRQIRMLMKRTTTMLGASQDAQPPRNSIK